MPRIRALTSWAGRNAGDEFDISDEAARVLCATDLPGGQKAEYCDRALRAVEPAAKQTELREPEGKRRYMRRDMQAQS